MLGSGQRGASDLACGRHAWDGPVVVHPESIVESRWPFYGFGVLSRSACFSPSSHPMKKSLLTPVLLFALGAGILGSAETPTPRINHIACYVADLKTSTDFYEK